MFVALFITLNKVLSPSIFIADFKQLLICREVLKKLPGKVKIRTKV